MQNLKKVRGNMEETVLEFRRSVKMMAKKLFSRIVCAGVKTIYGNPLWKYQKIGRAVTKQIEKASAKWTEENSPVNNKKQTVRLCITGT